MDCKNTLTPKPHNLKPSKPYNLKTSFMKRIPLLSSLVLLLSMVCSNSHAQKKDWPWDFPKATKIDVKAGQMALAPYSFYPSAVSEGKDLIDQTMIFYSEKVKSVKAIANCD